MMWDTWIQVAVLTVSVVSVWANVWVLRAPAARAQYLSLCLSNLEALTRLSESSQGLKLSVLKQAALEDEVKASCTRWLNASRSMPRWPMILAAINSAIPVLLVLLPIQNFFPDGIGFAPIWFVTGTSLLVVLGSLQGFLRVRSRRVAADQW